MKKNSIIVLALMVIAGCSSKSTVTSDESPVSYRPSLSPSSSSIPSSPQPPSGYGFDQWQTGPLGDVFFDYDSATLSTEAQEQLRQNGVWMGNNTATTLIEGHCDARGTSEYNIALGDRRAASAKEYLIRFGISSSRIETVSFGEERPFVQGQNEEAWAKNRRAHFIVK